MLSIGDGANDVAMIQAADVGIGIAGKEGRQAVNNSDYAIGQFRFLVRLLLVHGQLSHYRLGRLIKFSFFKNISFAFILIYYQFFCGFSGELFRLTFVIREKVVSVSLSDTPKLVAFSNPRFSPTLFSLPFTVAQIVWCRLSLSEKRILMIALVIRLNALSLTSFLLLYEGQTLIDDISAAMYNVVFTSMPILLFSVLDRPVGDITLIRFPQMYNRSTSLATSTFWRTGILHGCFDAAVCFFIPYIAMATSFNGQDTNYGLWAVGKTIFVSLLGAVTLEAVLVARYWTVLFSVFSAMSYVFVYPYMIAFPYLRQSLNEYDHSQFAVQDQIFRSTVFWMCIISVYVITFGYR